MTEPHSNSAKVLEEFFWKMTCFQVCSLMCIISLFYELYLGGRSRITSSKPVWVEQRMWCLVVGHWIKDMASNRSSCWAWSRACTCRKLLWNSLWFDLICFVSYFTVIFALFEYWAEEESLPFLISLSQLHSWPFPVNEFLSGGLLNPHPCPATSAVSRHHFWK